MVTKKTLGKTPSVKKATVTRRKKVATRANNSTLAIEEDYMAQEQAVENDKFPDDYLYSWEAPEFLYHAKSLQWHLIAYSALLVIVGIMAYIQAWFSIPVFLLLALLVYQYAEVKPKNIEVIITTLGVVMGDKFYSFNDIKSFWVVYNPRVKVLNIELTKRFSPIISIQLDAADAKLVKDIMGGHVVEEEGRQEDIIDKVVRMLRF